MCSFDAGWNGQQVEGVVDITSSHFAVYLHDAVFPKLWFNVRTVHVIATHMYCMSHAEQ